MFQYCLPEFGVLNLSSYQVQHIFYNSHSSAWTVSQSAKNHPRRQFVACVGLFFQAKGPTHYDWLCLLWQHHIKICLPVEKRQASSLRYFVCLFVSLISHFWLIHFSTYAALATIPRPLSSFMCSITPETANVCSSYNRMRGPGIGCWFSDRSNCSHWSFEAAVLPINPHIYTDQ